LGQTVGGTNLLFATLGVGMMVGALILTINSQIGENFMNIVLCLGGVGLGFILLSYTYVPVLAAVILFFVGIAGSIVIIPMDTYLQKHVPDSFRGRVFVARGFIVGVGFLLSLQFSKAIIFHFGTLKTLQILGGFAMILGVSGYLVHRCFSTQSLPSTAEPND
jgi:hypothetical protein